jgi:hypothetical protein
MKKKIFYAPFVICWSFCHAWDERFLFFIKYSSSSSIAVARRVPVSELDVGFGVNDDGPAIPFGFLAIGLGRGRGRGRVAESAIMTVLSRKLSVGISQFVTSHLEVT